MRKLLIIGNIGAGKTTLGLSLQKETHLEIVPLDRLRQQYGDSTIVGEYLSYYQFLRACQNDSPSILEFTGAGFHKHAVRIAFQEGRHEIIVFYLSVSPGVCKERIRDRDWSNIPYPYSVEPEKVLLGVHRELETDWEHNFWKWSQKGQTNCFRLDGTVTPSEIRKEAHHILSANMDNKH